MAHDQCPSSKKEGLPVHGVREALSAVGTTGSAYWRGLDDALDTPIGREFLEREFQDGASELEGESRRDFLKYMGAGLALAGVATMPGCRRPDHKILPYSRNVPEDVVPGKSLFYATSMPLPGGGAEGLLIETHEGRPTKVEGNPLHPINQGKSSVWSQASVLDLYDPDRLTGVTHLEGGADVERTWDDFAAWSKQHFAAYDASKGEGLAFVCDYKTSPTLSGMRAKVLARWPKARWVWWNAMENATARAGLAAAFGRPAGERLMLYKAAVIVSLDRDFLSGEAAGLAHACQFAATRRALSVKDDMSRLYAFESYFSLTGAAADHRYGMSPSAVAAFAVALAKFVLAKKAVPGTQPVAAAIEGLKAVDISGVDAKLVQAVGEDLADDANRGRCLVVAGPTQPEAVHALCAALNGALGSIGKTVAYHADADDGGSSVDQLKALRDALAAGSIKTVVSLNANPCFNAPADLGFAEAFVKAPERICLSVDRNETSAASTWKLNGTHYLEQWGDTRAADGTIAPIQPMIAPLYGGMSDIETLAMVLGAARPGYELVREQWRADAGTLFPRGAGDFEKLWRRALHDGVLAGAATAGTELSAVAHDKVAALVAGLKAAPGAAGTLEVVFLRGPMDDGRWLNNAWIQELPDTCTRIVWDNAALMSPATARSLGVHQTSETDKKPQARVAAISLGGRSATVACWAVPGIPDGVVVLPMGWGRRTVGLVGEFTGFDVFPLRASGAMWAAPGATLQPAAGSTMWHHIVAAQLHGSMEGRAIVREMDVQAWQAHGEEPFAKVKDSYGREKSLSLAEQLKGSEMAHMPANISIYKHPFRDPDVKINPGKSQRAKPGVAAFDVKPQWGMTIDLSTCIGCNVCTVACQAENNIPTIGKAEVNKGRIMHWIRVDRYFKGPADRRDVADGMVYQPVACVHCENAPCETVCPVNATVHGIEGHNYMAYNRCIGTRYCANNCPYKVRRFNFFDYGVTKFKGPYFGQETLESVIPGEKKGSQKINPNLIPPRLRKKLDEISKMGKNPNVTVRSRGVMEKCTYCIQRTNELKIDLKLKAGAEGKAWRPEDGIPDGAVQTACQQACPTGAIVFGDILDATSNGGKGSMVHQLMNHHRSYKLLGYLNTQPRTVHLARLNNPNGKLRRPEVNPFGEHHHHDHGAGGHASFVDPSRAGRGDGYVMSLGVLGERS
ncbi:MAG: TAT-variant-translocated molybdopterin oxidoreductase [Phycisphaerae bacterium]|nr:TAT-variant-translocated molybdopterin oxidoreductase [Phycisphaerae bacterium]